MRELVVARHAESEFNVLERLNGDPSVQVVLTEAGRAQARALGAEAGPVDLVAHSSFGRARETAELAWPGTPLRRAAAETGSSSGAGPAGSRLA